MDEKKMNTSRAGGNRPYGKPAGGVTRTGSGRTQARPAGSSRGYSKPAGDRPFGKPAGERSFGKPAGDKSFDKSAGARPFGKPAGDKPFGRPALRTTHSDAPQPLQGLETRRLALRVLRAVTEEGAWASLSLNNCLTSSGLKPEDRRLVSRLVYDTLDHLIYLDYCLAQVMAKPDTDIKLRNILRLGACQILLEDRIPESAATNTAVALCTELGMEGLKGVCNGILRNLVRRKEAGELTMPDPAAEPDLAVSIRYSVPLWLAKRVRQQPEAFLPTAHFRQESDQYITVRPNLTRLDAGELETLLQKKVWEKKPGVLPGVTRLSGMADLSADADFKAGMFSIQSESSMMACLAVTPKRGGRVLDCCAAPGGKSCYLAELMGGTGRVQAWDVHEHRVKLIEAQVRRLGLENVRPMTRDATVYREDLAASMDAVLLDAPCSGLGVLADKPDLKLRVTEESVEELTALQAKLLNTVCNYVRPGGVLVYSTCSVLKEENEDQILRFLKDHPDFRLSALPETIPAQFRQYEATGLQLLPHRDGVEGFYICRLVRV